METVTVDGFDYTVSSKEAGDRLRADLAKGEGPMAETHAKNLAGRGAQAAADLRDLEEQEREEKDAAEARKSGATRALLAGMSNDQAYQMHWLAQQRFPDLAEDMNLSDLYFLDEDDDIAYLDPYTGEIHKEFKDNLFGDLMNTYGLVGPALQFVPEVVGGTIGMTAGTLTTLPGGGLPGAMIGGAGGTLAGGAVGLASRAGISAAFDGPPLNVGQAANDLLINSAFGALPIGQGFIRGSRPLLNKISTDFAGEDGANMIRTLLTEGGDTPESLMQMAQDRFGITLTRAEALGLKSNASQVQRYLQMQPSSQKLFDFYNDRALQMEEAFYTFFDELQSGKYMTGKVGQALKEAGERGGFEFEKDLAEATDSAIRKLAEARQNRAKEVYQEAFRLGEEEGLAIDISQIGNAIKERIEDPNTGDAVRSVLEKVLKSITNPVQSPLAGQGFKTDTRALHNAVMEDLKPLYEQLAKNEGSTVAAVVGDLKGQIVNAIKAANPIYARANKIFNPDQGHLQILDRGLIKSLADAVEKGGTAAVPLVKRMFDGKASAEELKRLRELIQEEDPTVWQNLKANWLRTQLDEVIVGTSDPFGVPNKFLQKIGLKNPRRAFQTGRRGEQQRRGRVAAFREILGPEEFEVFKEALEVAQAVSYIATQTGSPTQPLLAMQRQMEKEAAGLSKPVMTALRSIVELPQRLVVRGFDDLSQSAIGFQREAYEDSLIRALIDPQYAAELVEGLNAIKPYVYLATQSAARGVDMPEAMEPSEFNAEGRPTTLGDENLELKERMRELEEQQQTSVSPIASLEPLPIMPTGGGSPAMMSPTLLPSEEDRQIAMRQQGIAGLV